jgi:hypothetical protein
MAKIILSICLFAMSFAALAQNQPRILCGNELIPTYMEQRYPGYKNAVKASFDRAKQYKNLRSSAADTTIYKINIVFHVIWNDSTENLADSVIFSQLQVLNEDYRHHNPDSVNTVSYFDSVAGDARIEFAIHDIRRVHTSATFSLGFGGLPDSLIKQTANGGDDAVDPNHFLNIWIVNIQASFFGQLLGYSYPPDSLANWPLGSTSPYATWDGVVIDYRCIGRNNPNPLNFSGQVLDIRGRTPTHEIGHYLGLRHIWGDGATFGTNDCMQSDGIDDTPFANTQSNFDCATTRNSCTQIETYYGADAPDMVQNYMDYSAESCMNLFTKGQVALMRGTLADQRQGLVSGYSAGVAAVKNETTVSIYPNPSTGVVYVPFSESRNPYSSVEVYNMLGENIGAVSVETAGAVKIDLGNQVNGIYTIDIVRQGQHYAKRAVLSK